MKLLSSLELLTFDMAVCDSVFDPGDGSKFTRLFDVCFHPGQDKLPFDFDNENSFPTHWKSVVERLNIHLDSITKTHHQITAKSISPRFDVRNENVTEQLEAIELPEVIGVDRNPAVSPSVDIDPDVIAPINPAVPAADFAELLCGITGTPKLHRISRLTAYRLTLVQELQERISILRDLAEFDEVGTYDEVFLPDAIKNSPFMKARQRRVSFLSKLEQLSDRSRTADRLQGTIEKVAHQVDAFCNRWGREAEAIEEELNKLIVSMSTQRDEITGRKRQAQPLIDRAIETFTADTAPGDHSDKIAEKLRDIRTRLPVRDIQVELDRLEVAFCEIDALYKEGMKELQRSRFQERTLMQLQAERHFIADAPQRLAMESHCLERYEKQLCEFKQSTDSIHDDGALEALAAFCRQANETRRISFSPESLDPQQYVAIDAELISQRRLMEMIKERDVVIGEMTVELERLRERAFGCGGADQGGICGDEPPNSVFESNLAALTAMAVCQICKRRNRDSLLTTCGHSFCRICLETKETKRTCPLCSKPYELKSLKNFLV